MNYISTRGENIKLSSAEAIVKGIANDGGLYVPESIPVLSGDDIKSMKDMSYGEIALKVLTPFLTDYTGDELKECISKAYTSAKFETDDIVPLHRLNEFASILEIWHGPTCAFKDIALQILPHLLVKAMKKTGETRKVLILVATSGDTGKAALEGFRDVEGTGILVFYPKDGVSEVQRLQMITQEGGNVGVVAVEGNFDDAQNGVKNIFTDKAIAGELADMGYSLSSANSINWGRLVPQIVYYFSSYMALAKSGQIEVGDAVNFVVPTGNFGNILAGYYAKKMGLPIKHLICASNDNNVLTDFINTGVYNRKREFKKTISPSMDILISSNLERLLFEITGHNATKVAGWMESLKTTGVYTVDDATKAAMRELFWGGYATEQQTMDCIRDIYDEYGYVVDTHTAVAMDVFDRYGVASTDATKTIIVSTASPFKFNMSVSSAIFSQQRIVGKSEFELLSIMESDLKLHVPDSLNKLDEKPVRHKMVCEKQEMYQAVKNWIAK